MTTRISSQTGPDVNPQLHKRWDSKPFAQRCVITKISAQKWVIPALLLSAAPGQGQELTTQRGWTDPVASCVQAGCAERPSSGMADVWEITLYWYLEWINRILTDALEQLDALDSPEIWMDDVAESYLTHGVPGDLSLVETLQFLATVDAADALLAQPPETLAPSATDSFRGLLAEMKAAAQSAG